MSAAWFVDFGEDDSKVYYYDQFPEALGEFLRRINEGAEDATLKWSS